MTKMRPNQTRRGLTLIELTIGLAIVAMLIGVSITSMNALTDADLRSSSVQMTGAIKFAYDRAIMEKRVERIGMDLEKGLWWLEYTDDPYALSAEKVSGNKGEGLEEDSEDLFGRRTFDEDDEDIEVKKALEGGRSASFVPDGEYGKPHPLPGNVIFSKAWTGHQEEPFSTGVAYLHFFRSGFTEPAQIELFDGEDYLTLTVAPLTGRARTHDGRLEDPKVDEPDGREEGDP